MEEFQEADIMWPDHHHHHHQDHDDDDDAGGGGVGGSSDDCTDIEVQILGRSKAAAPVPVVVPAKDRVSHSWTLGFNFSDIYVDREDDGGGGSNEEIVPPHILISRRFNNRHKKMAFSVCIGKGRTLKGRDLCHVRNSILRMTGFLER